MDSDTRTIVSQLQSAQRAQSNARPPNNRLLDGLSSSLTGKLELLSRNQLLELRERDEKLLQNESLVATLPDRGAKLRNSIAQIDALLQKQEQQNLDSVQEDDARQRILNQANTEAEQFDGNSSLLHPKMTEEHPSRTRMMRLDDSMKLQNEHQKYIKDEKLKRQLESLRLGTTDDNNSNNDKNNNTSGSLADSLSVTLEGMRLDPELGPHRPQDDDSDEYEEDSEDEESIPGAHYGVLYSNDDEGFEEDDCIFHH